MGKRYTYGNFIIDPFQPLVRLEQFIEQDTEYSFILEMPGEMDLKWTFHDGREVKADDLVYSIKYAIKQGTLSANTFSFKNTT